MLVAFGLTIVTLDLCWTRMEMNAKSLGRLEEMENTPVLVDQVLKEFLKIVEAMLPEDIEFLRDLKQLTERHEMNDFDKIQTALRKVSGSKHENSGT